MKYHVKRFSAVMLAVLLILTSALPLGASAATDKTSSASASGDITVEAASNYAPTAEAVFSQNQDQITVTYWINCQYKMVNCQWELAYDETMLEFDKTPGANLDPEGEYYMNSRATIINGSNEAIINVKNPGLIIGNASNPAGYRLNKNGGKVPFFTFTFKITDRTKASKTKVELSISLLTLTKSDGFNSSDYISVFSGSKRQSDVNLLPEDDAVTVTEGVFDDVTARSISGCGVTLSPGSFTYDGNAKTPGVTVKYGSVTLTENTDYTVIYRNFVKAGTASAVITGKGRYTGSKTETYTIAPRQISLSAITLSQSSYKYDGTAKTPSVTLSDSGKTLTEGTDYTVSYKNNTEVGTATVTATGRGNYTGTKQASFTITGAPKTDISNASVTLSQSQFTFDGTAKTPSATVKDGTKTLEEGADYTVSYKNNLYAGTATATITGAGQYSGSKTASFTISPKNISGLAVRVIPSSLAYDGARKTPSAILTDAGKALVRGTDYTVSYRDNINAGRATVILTGHGNYTGEKITYFTITARSVSGVTIHLNETEFTYDGASKTPEIAVADGTKPLVSGTDYTISCKNNTNAGTATVTVNGKGNYNGTKSAEFTISPKSVSGARLELSSTSFTYDGTEKMPLVKAYDGTKLLVNGTDYTLSYKNNTNPGTATVTVNGRGNYSGEKSAEFTIGTKSIENAQISVQRVSYTYDGTAKTPSATVTDGSAVLTEGEDYTLSYKNNINAGKATLIVNGTGRYAGTKSAEFTIGKRSVSYIIVTATPTIFAYDGEAKVPSVTVSDGRKTLANGTDYTITFYNNTKAGTATAAINGAGNYSGVKRISFRITARSISAAEIRLSQSSYVYDGKAKTPAVTVTDGAKTLVNGTDYTVSYKNNTNAGTASVTVSGKGNYSGTNTASFSIAEPAKNDISKASITLSPAAFTYDGTAKTPYLTVKDGVKTLVNGADYTVSYSNNTAAGTGKATISGTGQYSGSKTAEFTINPKPVSEMTVKTIPATLTYDGSQKTPSVIVTDGSKTLVNGIDYTVSYQNNTNAGTARATVSGKGNYAGEKSAEFTISAKSISDAVITLSETSFVYDGTAKTPAVTVTDGTKALESGKDYVVSYTGNIKTGAATVEVTGMGNYTGAQTAGFTISARQISGAEIKLSSNNFTYDGTEKTPSVTVTDGTKALVNGTDYTVSYKDNKNAGKATATVSGKGQYSGTKAVEFTINARSISGASLTISPNIYVYDGMPKTPDVKVTENSKVLSAGTDYTLSFKNNTAVGTASVTVTGKGNYMGTKAGSFIIEAEPDPFEWGRDNWTFDNNINYFKNYGVNAKVMKQMNKDLGLSYTEVYELNNAIYNSNSTGYFNGACFGMTVSEIMAKNGSLNLANYGGNSVVSKNKNTDDMVSVINYLQAMQSVSSCNQLIRQAPYISGNHSQYDFIDRAESVLQNEKVLVKISYGIRKIDKNTNTSYEQSYHAVLAYGIEDCAYYSRITGKTYDKRILVADPNYLSKNKVYDDACIYYKSNDHSWIIPYWCKESRRYLYTTYWNASAGSNTSTGIIRNIMKYNTITDMEDLMADYRVNHYIAGLELGTEEENYEVDQVERSGNPNMDYAGGQGSGIRKYNIELDDEDLETAKVPDNLALWNPTASYTLSYDIPTDYSLKMDYEKTAFYGKFTNGFFNLFKPDGTIEFDGSNAGYDITIVTDADVSPTDWYALEVTGDKVDNLVYSKVKNGYVLKADNLNNVTVKATADNANAEKTFSTNYDSVFIYEISKEIIGIRVDADGNGTYETDLFPADDQAPAPGDLNGDGKINGIDAALLARYTSSWDGYDGKIDSMKSADVNGDGVVNGADAGLIARYTSGWENVKKYFEK